MHASSRIPQGEFQMKRTALETSARQDSTMLGHSRHVSSMPFPLQERFISPKHFAVSNSEQIQIRHVVEWLEQPGRREASLEAICEYLRSKFGESALKRTTLSLILDGEVIACNHSLRMSVLTAFAVSHVGKPLPIAEEHKPLLFAHACRLAESWPGMMSAKAARNVVFVGELELSMYVRRQKSLSASTPIGDNRYPVCVTVLHAYSIARGDIAHMIMGSRSTDVAINTFLLEVAQTIKLHRLQDESGGNNARSNNWQEVFDDAAESTTITFAVCSARRHEVSSFPIVSTVVIDDHDAHLNLAAWRIEFMKKDIVDEHRRRRSDVLTECEDWSTLLARRTRVLCEIVDAVWQFRFKSDPAQSAVL